jgi:hypothetical protein
MQDREESPGETIAASAGANGVTLDPWASKLEQLCVAVVAYVVAGNLCKALAACVAVLVLDDKSVYTRLSHASLSADPSVDQVVDSLDSLLHGGHFGAADSNKVFALTGHAPVSLIRWLDRLAHVSSGEAVGVAEWVYGGDVICVVFSDDERAALSLPAELATLYLARSRSHRSLAPIASSHVSPGYFLDHWEVAPQVPKRDMRERTVYVGAADESFSSACAQIGKEGVLRVFLAEFESPPEFNSQWVRGGGSEGAAGWCALGLHNEESIKQEAIAHLSAAVDAGADVVVFPELTITESIRSAISDWLSANVRIDDVRYGLKFVVCGSFHVGGGTKTGGRPWNRSVVLNRFGDAVTLGREAQVVPLDQAKLTSVDYSKIKGIYEANEKGRELLLCATPLGIHAVAICLDLAQGAEADQTALQSLPIRWLWVPSLSPQIKEHQAQSVNLCKQRTVTVACANQATADFGGAVGIVPGKVLASFVWCNKDRSSCAGLAVPVGRSALLVEVPVIER